MFQSLSHGGQVFPFGVTNSVAPVGSTFGYYFPNAPLMPVRESSLADLDALADAMVDAQEESGDSLIPPVMTYLGQFIDHDISGGTSTVADTPAQGTLVPRPRQEVQGRMHNARAGTLGLDSVYGDTPGQGPAGARFAALLRHPQFPAKMRIAFFTRVIDGVVPLPADGAGDLLRLGHLLDDNALTVADIAALPPEVQRGLLKRNGSPNVHAALLGDSRNDENLVIAQLHLAFLRLHNRLVDGQGAGDIQARFQAARGALTRIYQWLVIESYLPTICDRAIVSRIVEEGAPLYLRLLSSLPPTAPELLPLPIEFSAAAFRFGHSMVREFYDWNSFFDAEKGTAASLDLLFMFTGNSPTPMPNAAGGAPHPRLPSNWGADWSRLALPVDLRTPFRSARKIDPYLTPQLHNLPFGGSGVAPRLAHRNLRKGFLLNLPGGQACVAALNRDFDAGIEPLSKAELGRDAIGDAVRAGGFDEVTPLWFYILREAEVRADGQHLGPLGSWLVASTLVGLIQNDPASYWNTPGGSGGRWHPTDDIQPPGDLGPVTSLPGLLRAALVL